MVLAMTLSFSGSFQSCKKKAQSLNKVVVPFFVPIARMRKTDVGNNEPPSKLQLKHENMDHR
jgi:hypothetical protein